ncbi:MAG TPA: glycosyltransferase family 39 protein [Anaerolineae bacterium]
MIDRLRRVPASAWLLVLILLAFAIRLGSIDFQSLWRDETDAAGFGPPNTRMGAVLAGGDLQQLAGALTQGGFNGPLYFIALQQWTTLAGSTAFALRFPSTFFGILALALIYLLMKRLFKRATHLGDASRAGLLAAWLAALSPYFVWYSQEAKMYTEIAALALAAVYGLRRAIDAPDGRRAWPWWALVIGATTLAMYSHILAALLIGVEVVLFGLWWPQARRHPIGGLIALAALTLPYAPLLKWQVDLAFTPGSQGFAFFRFDDMIRVLLSGFTNGVLPFDFSLGTIGIQWNPDAFRPELSPANWGTWLLSLLALLGVFMWKDATDRAPRIGLAAWAILPIAVVALISLNRPIFTDRYLIWIGPAVYLLATLGLVQMWRWNRIAGGVAWVAVSVVMVIGDYAQAITPFKADFRSAARYVQERYQGEAILFQIPYGQYTFDYYFEPPFQVIEGPYTNWPDRDATSFDVEIAGLLSGQRAVWFVATEVEMWDNRYLLEEWLNRYGRVTDRADFMRVTALRYELR